MNRRKRFKPLSIVEFQERFATEEDCVHFFYVKRWPQGWACPRCGGIKCYPISVRRLYECAGCRYQVSVTAGTVLHKTRTPLRLWFLAIFFMTTDKRGISSVGLGKQLGIPQKRAWIILHKLRRAMGERDGRYTLDGLVELDESFFGAPREGGCRGRVNARNKVLVGLSLTVEGKPGHIRFKVLPRLDRAHLEEAVGGMVSLGATVKTNGLRGYSSLGKLGFIHQRVPVGDLRIPEELRWLQVVVSNARASIGGTYHGLGRRGGRHLQAYLDEFAYCFSRRHRLDLIFGRCVLAAAACPICTYRDIVGPEQVLKKPKLKVS